MSQVATAAGPGRVVTSSGSKYVQANKDQFRVLMAILVVMSLSKIHMAFPALLGRLRPALTLTAFTGLFALMRPKFLNQGSAFRFWPAKVIAALGVMACLSVPFGLSIGASGSFILYEYSKTLVLAFLVILAIRDAKDLYTMVWAVTLSGLALAYIGIFKLSMRVEGKDGLLRIQNGLSYDSNDMGLVCAVLLAFALLTFQVSKTRGKVISLVVMAGLGMTIARTGSRGTLIALGAMAVAALVLLKRIPMGKKIAALGLIGAGVVVAAPEGYWQQMLTILAPTNDYNWTSESGRKELAMRGLGYMASHPLTGLGVMNFGRAEGTLSDLAVAKKSGESDLGVKWSAAHNTFIQAGAEMGVPGLVLMLMLVVGGVIRTVQLQRQLPKEWATGDAEQRFIYATAETLPCAMFAFAAGSNFVSFAYLDPVYVLGALICGLYVCVEVKAREAAGLSPGATAESAPKMRRVGRGGLSWLPVPQPQPAAPTAPVINRRRRRG